MRELVENLIANFSHDNLIKLFRNKTRSFSRYNPEDFSHINDDLFSECTLLGSFETTDDNLELLVFTAKTNNDLSERSGKKRQYELGKRVLKEQLRYSGGFFIFYDSKGNFRFSLIYDIPLPNGKVKFSNFKRYTYFVSPDQTNKTFIRQIGEAEFTSLPKIIEAFSVDKVREEFYHEIATWYFWAMDKVRFPDDYKYSSDQTKDAEIRNSTNLIRLLTRIIFIWFLKEKKLVPLSLFDAAFLKRIVKDFYKGKESSNYYNAILQNLFFGTLNQKMNERAFAREGDFSQNQKEYGVKNLYRYADKFAIPSQEAIALFKDIPFLNGGLFDCLDKEDETGKVIYIDGFSRNPAKQAIINDYLFFQADEERVNLSAYEMGKDKTVRGLFEILKSYSFTIDESTPVDQEVALDPEMLGKVFEELLASYNPETSTTARKATGSFYTPREIVDYMVQQSLKHYLLTNSHLDEATVEHLLSFSDETPALNENQKKEIIELVDNIKILDPACGSGAFPMGILHQLVYILQKLDPDNRIWKEIQLNKALEETKKAFTHSDMSERGELLKEINESFDESINYPDYARKLYLIENCIYGVDIQPIAIQISKLRFFISLVLDQKIDFKKENLGIRPLPNLETKFVAANTLIALNEPPLKTGNLFLNEKVQEIVQKREILKDIRHRYFNCKNRKDKLKIQGEDKKIRKEIYDLLIEIGYTQSYSSSIVKFDPYDQNHSADWFNPEWMFGVTDGFDIVIGNPPYIQLQKAFNGKFKYADLYKDQHYQTFDRTGDIYCLFYEKGLQLLKPGGHLCYITSNKWMRARYGEKLRLFFASYNPVLLIDLGPGVFENATVDTNILLIRKEQTEHKQLKALTLQKRNGDVNINEQVQAHAVILHKLANDAWFIGSDAEQRLKEKIESVGKPIKEWDVKINYGIKTGLNEAFIIDSKKREEILANCTTDDERKRTEAIIKPILRGRDIKRYYYEWAGLWVIGTFPALHLDIEDYPALKKYFLDHFDIRQLEQSGKKYSELGFDARKKTGNKWFETQDQIAYYPEFEKEKIIYPNMTKFLPFVYDDKKIYPNPKCYVLTGNNLKYLLGVFNSNVCSYWIKTNCPELQGGTREIQARVFLNFTPPPITPTNEPIVKQIENLVDKILAAKQQNPQTDTSQWEKEIDELVYRLYDLTEEEVKIIEENS